ncbi:ubiquinone biosynthesis protein [Salmonella enterica subsp. enterica]|nr:ubiquinone biosynthesis protein [Salmonella enterica subsp. enterica] [Salmonella enterica subsp. enterica serovar Menston]
MLYIPEVYSDYCSQNMMGDGADIRHSGFGCGGAGKERHQHGNCWRNAGLKFFFTQVFRDSFFHADMHPGNIFVSHEHPENPQYIGIDCGIVGSLNKEDKRYLAENFIAFLIAITERWQNCMSIQVGFRQIPTLKICEFAIRTVCEPIFEKPLAEISFGSCVVKPFQYSASI